MRERHSACDLVLPTLPASSFGLDNPARQGQLAVRLSYNSGS